MLTIAVEPDSGQVSRLLLRTTGTSGSSILPTAATIRDPTIAK